MYFITCFQKYEIDELGWPNVGSGRTFGYYNDRDVALEAVRDNWCDIQERIYRYAVVEHIEEGLYNPATDRWFFEWNEGTKTFEAITPFVDHCGNYAFG